MTSRLGRRGRAPAAPRLRQAVLPRRVPAITWRPILPFVLLLGVWWLVKISFRLGNVVLPSPLDAARAAGVLLQQGVLSSYVTRSLERMVIGAGIAIGAGVPAGLLLGSNRLLSLAFQPYLKFFTALSGIAWLPMMLVWFGFTNRTILAIIIYTAFFPIAFNTMMGVRTVPPQLANAVRVLGASRRRLIRDVWLPGSLPSIVMGLRLGIAYGWRALIAGEMVVGAGGIGFLIFQAQSFHLTSQIVVGMIMIGLLWVFIDQGFLRPLERATVQRWGMEQR